MNKLLIALLVTAANLYSQECPVPEQKPGNKEFVLSTQISVVRDQIERLKKLIAEDENDIRFWQKSKSPNKNGTIEALEERVHVYIAETGPLWDRLRILEAQYANLR